MIILNYKPSKRDVGCIGITKVYFISYQPTSGAYITSIMVCITEPKYATSNNAIQPGLKS